MTFELKIGLYFLIATWLLTGIYTDDEFGEHSFFLKYRPSFQFYYQSPLGMQDMPASYPTDLVLQKAIYDEFINEKHWSDNDFLATSICSILYVGTIYFLTAGTIKQFKYDK